MSARICSKRHRVFLDLLDAARKRKGGSGTMVVASISEGIISSAGAVVGAIAGAVAGGYLTRRAALPYFQQASLQRASALVQARVAAYTDVLKGLQRYSDENGNAVRVDPGERRAHGERLRDWYHQQGGGLLLGGDAFNRFLELRDALYDPDAVPEHVYAAVTAFRTELKIEIGSREVSEASVPYARSTERRLRQASENAARG